MKFVVVFNSYYIDEHGNKYGVIYREKDFNTKEDAEKYLDEQGGTRYDSFGPSEMSDSCIIERYLKEVNE